MSDMDFSMEEYEAVFTMGELTSLLYELVRSEIGREPAYLGYLDVVLKRMVGEMVGRMG